jgi:hypothetical protein
LGLAAVGHYTQVGRVGEQHGRRRRHLVRAGSIRNTLLVQRIIEIGPSMTACLLQAQRMIKLQLTLPCPNPISQLTAATVCDKMPP